MAYLDFTGTTQTSITVRISGLDTTSQGNKGSSRLPRHNSYQISCLGDVRTASTGSGGSSGSVTYAGLTPGTNYDFAGIVNFTDINSNTGDVNFYSSCATDSRPAPVRPANWAWWSTVATGQPIGLTSNEWNAFCGRIDAFREYAGYSPWGGFLPVSTGTGISAAIVNAARAAIAPMTGAVIPPYINPGDTITAGYFNALKNYLNSIT